MKDNRHEPVPEPPSRGSQPTMRNARHAQAREAESDPLTMGSVPTTGHSAEILGRIDRYELLRELGGGAFGCVFLARDTEVGNELAVKGLPPLISHSKEELDRIRDNFALVFKLHHPHIAPAMHLHRARNVWYARKDAAEKLRVSEGDYLIVMAYAPGVTLSRWRKQFPDARVPVDRAVGVCRQLADALDYSHSQKVIHRDIKPSNIMVETLDDDTVCCRVLDFGLAAEVRSSLSRVSREVTDTSGTRPYMAPEQWTGNKQGSWTDQYALGVLFYDLVDGAVPFASAFETGDPVVMERAATIRVPTPLAQLSEKQNDALLRALAKRPDARFATCRDFIAALSGAAPTSRDHGRSHTGRPGRFLKRLALPAAVSALIWLGISQVRKTKTERPARTTRQADGEDARAKQVAALLEEAQSLCKASKYGEALEKVVQASDLDPGNANVEKLRRTVRLSIGVDLAIPKRIDADDALKRARRLGEVWPGYADGIEAQELQFGKGEAFYEEKEYGLAAEHFQEVINACALFEQDEVVRKRALEAKAMAAESRTSAAAAQAERDGATPWREAQTALNQAEKQYGSGRFREAESAWTDAAADFAKARDYAEGIREVAAARNSYLENLVLSGADSDSLDKHNGNACKRVKEAVAKAKLYAGNARWTEAVSAYAQATAALPAAMSEARRAQQQSRIQGILSAALAAKRRGSWGEVFDHANAVLVEYADHPQALSFKNEAELHMAVVWRVVTTLDGRRVPGIITVNDRNWVAPENLPLERGGTFTARFSYTDGGRTYTADPITVTADWTRTNEQTVVLREVREETTPSVDGQGGKTAAPNDSAKAQGNAVVTKHGSQAPMEGQPWTVPGLEMRFVWVGSGVFRMGSNSGERDEGPVHTVRIARDFWLGKYEVTQREYAALIGENPSWFKGDRNPVERVCWEDATAYCKKLTERESAAKRLPDGYEYRLPTEAEWEYAARGGAQGRGYKYAGSNDPDKVAWHNRNNNSETRPVGRKAPNELGLHDMSGNVWECCLDWHDDDYYKETRTGASDPVKLLGGGDRVSRGGGWRVLAEAVRSTNRSGHRPRAALNDLGFRVCLGHSVR